MIELTADDLPDYFATLLVYGESRMAFGAEHDEASGLEAKIFKFTFDPEGTALRHIERVPLLAAFVPFNVSEERYVLYSDVARQALPETLVEAVGPTRIRAHIAKRKKLSRSLG